ncbi:MAG TPA: hypothetical protein VF006_32205 [Longimicrobium sp.]
MMTIQAWLTRPLRRFAGTAAMVFTAHAGGYRALQARPDLPPASVDRVEVMTMDGSHTITDRPALARIVAIVRAYHGEWTRFPDTVCLLASPSASFYQGTVRRGSIVLGTNAIVLYTRHGASTRILSARDATELERLLKR